MIPAKVSEGSKSLSFVYTVSDIKVDKVIKGNISSGTIVKVKQYGGTFEGKEYTTDDSIEYYTKGTKGIFFLIGDNQPYGVVYPVQGDLRFKNGKLKVHKDNNLFKEGLSEDEAINTIRVAKEKSDKK